MIVTYPNDDVKHVVKAVLKRVMQTLPDNLEGIYLRGSLVLGDFNPDTSDFDLLVVTKHAVTEPEFALLDEMHEDLQTLPNRYAHELELVYLPVGDINDFQGGRSYPSLERGGNLQRKILAVNWILEFWTVREHGVTLYGTDPKNFIELISSHAIVAAVKGACLKWKGYVDTWDDPNWQSHMGELRYVVEAMCRIAYTLERKVISSKPTAVRWALVTLPEPWPTLVRHAQEWQANIPTDSQTVSEVRKFVYWIVAPPHRS
jgi:predicted nucleotidyltransferase